jgi:hypothetical protein
MVVSDRVYYRIPKFWLWVGLAFLVLGLIAGPEYRLFWAHMVLGALCIGRSWQVAYQRRKINRRRRMTVLTKTQKLDNESLLRSAGE